MQKNIAGRLFLITSLFILIVGILFGIIGSLQYIIPGFLKAGLPFNKIRPLHVTLVTGWIVSAAVAGVYFYFPDKYFRRPLSQSLAIAHYIFYVTAILISVILFCSGIFGGREYLEYPPYVSVLFVISWIIFAINFFSRINFRPARWPVYIWMWSTGILFFLLTYAESALWLMQYFFGNVVRDITVQWKSLGSMVGAWNMLIYGTAIFLVGKINDDESKAHSKQAFFLYFLGLTNLMFNWGHHTYIIPAASYIKNISYIISMTELLILGNIILGFKRSVTEARKNLHILPYRFLISSDAWIFLNLLLAILISIPAVNLYTHGTHITVAHSMGATIGINTTILFASVFFIIRKSILNNKTVISAIRLFNLSLFVFWCALIYAGIYKGRFLAIDNSNFIEIMNQLRPVFILFSISGFMIFISISIIVINVIRSFFTTGRNNMIS